MLEFVPGESLDAHIRRGALPLDEALPLAGQVAEALEAAHDKGIVHRDLKPANIAVTPDGRAKILDFGLAKALDPAATTSTPAMSQSPTMVTMTAGVIIGTAAYMSPEQARGKPVDRRADIWAFGCVLYEMVTGTPAFDGETVSDTIGAIMRADPDWSRLPPDTPANVRALLQRCLRKDARARLPHIGVARLELSEPAAAHTGEPTRVARASIVPWGMAAVLAIALAAIGASVWLRQPEQSLGLVRFEIQPADETWTFGHTVPQRGMRTAGAAFCRVTGRPHAGLRALARRVNEPLGPPALVGRSSHAAAHRGRVIPLLVARRTRGRVLHRERTQESLHCRWRRADAVSGRKRGRRHLAG